MNVSKLKGKIVENGTNVEGLAAKIGIDRATLYRKLNGESQFTIGDAAKIKDALQLSSEEATQIFLP